jgi:subtilisin family serine protease
MWSARVVWVLCFLAIGSILPPTTARATVGHPVMAAPAALPDIVSGQLVLSFSPDIDEATRDRIVAARGGVTLTRLAGVGARVVASHAGRPLGEEARAYAATAGVRYVEPNYRYHTARIPNDTGYSNAGLWGLNTIGAPAAWDHTTGDRGIVVGIVDSGIDYTHGDLAANIWSAPTDWSLEGCGPGTHGFQAVGTTVNCEPMDTLGLGTQIAGTIGAVGDNADGIAGINWQVSLMALKCKDTGGFVQIADAVRVLDFAIAARRAGVNLRVLVLGWGRPALRRRCARRSPRRLRSVSSSSPRPAIPRATTMRPRTIRRATARRLPTSRTCSP